MTTRPWGAGKVPYLVLVGCLCDYSRASDVTRSWGLSKVKLPGACGLLG